MKNNNNLKQKYICQTKFLSTARSIKIVYCLKRALIFNFQRA